MSFAKVFSRENKGHIINKNASCEILKLAIEMLKVVRDDDDDPSTWNRIHNLISEFGPTAPREADSYYREIALDLIGREQRRQKSEFKPVPIDEPAPPF